MDWRGPASADWKRYDPQKADKYDRDPGTSTCSLSGQFLATCQQIYFESSDVLYGENTFGLYIYLRDGFGDDNGRVLLEASFFEGFKIDELYQPWPEKMPCPRGNDATLYQRLDFEFGYPFAVKKIRHLRLVLDLDASSEFASHAEYSLLKNALQLACQCIGSSQLQDLNIDLQSRFPMTRFCVLGPLMIFNNLRQVTFEPEPQNPLLIRISNQIYRRRSKKLPRLRWDRSLARLRPQFADYLKRLLESPTPRSDHFLEHHSFHFVITFLHLHETPPAVYQHLGLLVANRQNEDCLEGPFEVCEHRTNGGKNRYQQQEVLSDDDEKSELFSELEEDELEDNIEEDMEDREDGEEDEDEDEDEDGKGMERKRVNVKWA